MRAKAIFLDRDGVIVNNARHYYIWQASQLEYIDGIFANLNHLQSAGYKLFVVSNQGGIAKGIYTEKDIMALHQLIAYDFAKVGITITDFAFCPHHDQISKCLCRKPGSIMIEKLMAKYDIDPAISWFIGDSETDMQAAQAAGLKGIQITANQNMYPFIEKLI